MTGRRVAVISAIVAVAIVVFGGVLFALWVAFGPRTVRVPTATMEPTIHAGDRLVVNSVVGTVRRGDIVVFKYPIDPSVRYVKRVVAVAGDSVRLDGTSVIVNGAPLAETRILADYGTEENTYREVSREGDGPYAVMYMRSSHESVPGMHFRGEGKYAIDEPYTVPADSVFVLGDNRDNSEDSRYWGPVPLANVTGKPMYVYQEKRGGAERSTHREVH